MSGLRGVVRAAVAAVAAAALVLGGAAVAHADDPPTTEQPLTPVDGAVGYTMVEPDGFPLVESEIGVGGPLSTTAGSLVDIGTASGGHPAVLVRVAALSATEDVTVFGAGGTSVLFAPRGTSASTSVLLPVVDGAVQLWSSAPAQTRIEVLAGFTGDTTKPGSIFALDEPVTRADTAVGLAGASLSPAPIEVGVTGRGGVPAEEVRAVVVTLDVTVPAATTLHVDAQSLPVPAGRSVLTTIVPQDSDGSVHVRTGSGTGSLRLDVRGWVVKAPFYAEQVNLEGSFVPTTGSSSPQTVALTAQAAGPAVGSVVVGELQDSQVTLGMLSATASTETTLLNLGEEYEGRGRGLVVDGSRGAAPQLVLTRSEQDTGALTLRRGSADVTWTPVGDIVSVEQHWMPGYDEPTISIESPADGSEQDLGDHGYFTLTGVAETPGSTVDRIEVSGPEGLIGTATLYFDDGSLDWEFDAAAPIDGTHTYTVAIFDRAGRTATDEIDIEVTAVDDDDVVTAPNVFLFNSPGDPENQGGLTILTQDDEGSPTQVSVDAKPVFSPGDTLVSAVTEATPEGVFVTVLSVDRVGDRWIANTAAASLEDVFFQTDINETRVLDDPDEIVADSDENAIEAPVGQVDAAGDPIQTDVEYGEGEGERVWVETENIDLDDYPDDWNGDEIIENAFSPSKGGAVSAAAPIAPASGVGTSFNASLGGSVNLLATWAKGSKTGPTLKEMSEEIKDPDAREQALKSKYEQIKSEDKLVVALGVKLQATLEFTAVLDTSIDWKWGFIPVGITINELTVKAVVTTKFGASLKASLSSEVAGTWWNAIGGFKLPTFTIFAGPIPVVFTNDIDFALKGKVSLEISIELPEIGHKSVFTYGFTYSDRNGYQTLSKDPVHSGSWGPFDSWDNLKLGAKFTAQFGPEAQLSTKIYSVVGPNMTLAGLVKFTGEIGGTLGGGFYANYKLALVIELKGGVKIVIWKKELGKFDFTAFSTEKPILQGKYPSGATGAYAPWIRGPAPPGRDFVLRA